MTYYTKASGGPTAEAPAETSTYEGFGGGSMSYLSQPLTLAKDNSDPVSLTIKLYFDPTYAVYAIDGAKMNNGVTGGFCAGSDEERVMRICTQRLVVSASTASAPPVLEQYSINDSSLVFLFFENNSPLGGYFKSYFREGFVYRGYVNDVGLTSDAWDGSQFKSWSTGPIFGIKNNADGTLFLANTIGEPSPSNENGGFRASAFKRETGTFF